MPFYEYECKTCGRVTESFEDIGTKRIPCPYCSPKPGLKKDPRPIVYAGLILSPTMTTFRHASNVTKQ